MEKYQNKYRIPSARAYWWDYGWNGAYFITICTQDRAHFFGEMADGKMHLSNTGVIADLLWHEIPYHQSSLELGDFVVMPNHIHGILILNKPAPVETLHATSLHAPPTETLRATSLQHVTPKSPNNEKMAAISPKSNTIPTIIRSYKSAVTKHANRLRLPNGWQPRFHDHIIRNDAEYQRISDYIVNNPANWQADKFYAPSPPP